MREERPTIDAPSGPMPTFLARSARGPSGPAVVVIQEWWGLNAQIEGVARRVAGSGFAALAPDLYRGRQADEPDEARKLAMALDDARALEDLRAAIGWLFDRGASGVGAIGFCMGGGLAWELARSDERLGAAISFYGGVDLRQGGPVLVPFQAHYGTEDRYPEEMLEAIEAHRADAPDSELHRYAGVGHGFMNEEHDEDFDPEAAELGWARALAFLRATLG